MSISTRASGRGPKIVVMGAGSMFFGRQAIAKTVTSEVLRTGTLALVDTDAPTLEKMTALAHRAVEAAGAPTTIQSSTDRRDVLAGADFVVLTFADRGIHFRGVDVEVSARHGVRMCSGDTIGPGGVFRTLREAHHVLAVAHDVEELCPDAWVINYINPSAALGILLMRHAPRVKSFALCDGHHEPRFRRGLLRDAGLLAPEEENPALEEAVDLAEGGVNHFTWLVRLRHEGVDYMPKLLAQNTERAAEDTDAGAHAKSRFNRRYRHELFEIFGACPTTISHTKEYVPYYQGHSASGGGLEPVALFDAPARAEQRAEVYREIDSYLARGKPMAEFLEKTPADHATDIIESMWGGLGKRFYVNTANRGAVTNMAPDAFLELRCDLDMDGPRPLPFGEMPCGVRGLSRQVLDTHELAVEAAVHCDRALLRRAMLTDPIVNSVADADAIIAELLEAERDALPAGWFGRGEGDVTG